MKRNPLTPFIPKAQAELENSGLQEKEAGRAAAIELFITIYDKRVKENISQEAKVIIRTLVKKLKGE